MIQRLIEKMILAEARRIAETKPPGERDRILAVLGRL